MTISEAILLGILQGFAEFLPISSSGHLVLVQHLLQVRGNENLTFDVFVHFGTLFSVIVVFRRDIIDITGAMVRALVSLEWKKQYASNDLVRLGFALAVSTIPAAFIGLIFRDAIKETFADPKLVSMNLVLTGLILFLTRLAKPISDQPAGLWPGFIIGIAQAVAILPGISRSGTTISTGLYLGLSPVQAARFSFLMSIPAIFGASILEGRMLIEQSGSPGFLPLVTGTMAAAAMGYLSIKVLLNVMQRGKLSWFAFYCLAVGILGILFI